MNENQKPQAVGKGGDTAIEKNTPKTYKKRKKLSPEAKEAARVAKKEENIAIGICPFYKQDRGCGRLSCEGASFRFPDVEARREFVYRFCAHPEGYKDCPLRITLEHYYERKYASHE